YVWIRAQCGAQYRPGSNVDSCVTHWGVDAATTWNPSKFSSTSSSDFSGRPGLSYFEAGSYGNNWDWVRLGSVNLTKASHTVNIWGGGSGFRLDKIVLSRNNEGPASARTAADFAPEFIRRATPTWNDVRNQPYQTYYSDKRYGGPADTRGRTGQACNKCNPLYGQRLNVDLNGSGIVGDYEGEVYEDLNRSGRIEPAEICDNVLDDIFDDQEPIRSAQEAAKNFVKRMRAPFEQVGFVAYSTKVEQSDERELNCIETPGRNGTKPSGQGIWDPETGPDNYWIWCYDERQGPDGYSEPISRRDPNVTHGSIIGGIEEMTANGYTNIADGMLKGLNILGSTTGHYGRPSAVKVMILLTDGVANRYPKECPGDDLWPDGGTAEDCVIYFAREAETQGVMVFTISLGNGADKPLMAAVADEANGAWFHAAKGAELDAIFQEIANRIFLRLVE
ncbi:MAG: VWA domain-containing protein, partial [Anaerolineae bacterium]|nr:VWA domain-containing protein [Anaerolineae bacterium]